MHSCSFLCFVQVFIHALCLDLWLAVCSCLLPVCLLSACRSFYTRVTCLVHSATSGMPMSFPLQRYLGKVKESGWVCGWIASATECCHILGVSICWMKDWIKEALYKDFLVSHQRAQRLRYIASLQDAFTYSGLFSLNCCGLILKFTVLYWFSTINMCNLRYTFPKANFSL